VCALNSVEGFCTCTAQSSEGLFVYCRVYRVNVCTAQSREALDFMRLLQILSRQCVCTAESRELL